MSVLGVTPSPLAEPSDAPPIPPVSRAEPARPADSSAPLPQTELRGRIGATATTGSSPATLRTTVHPTADRPGSSGSSGAPPRTRLHLVLPDGRTIALDAPLVLGREPGRVDPRHRGVAMAEDVELSRRHLMVQPTATAAEAVDQGSTNGTRLRRPDGRTVGLTPGVPVTLAPGDQLLLGEHTTVRIESR